MDSTRTEIRAELNRSLRIYLCGIAMFDIETIQCLYEKDFAHRVIREYNRVSVYNVSDLLPIDSTAHSFLLQLYHAHEPPIHREDLLNKSPFMFSPSGLKMCATSTFAAYSKGQSLFDEIRQCIDEYIQYAKKTSNQRERKLIEGIIRICGWFDISNIDLFATIREVADAFSRARRKVVRLLDLETEDRLLEQNIKDRFTSFF